MKSIPWLTSIMKRILEDEIDILLSKDTDRDELHHFDPHSLSPLREIHFKNGIGKLRPAYKKPRELKSVLEAGMYVSEVPIMRMKGNCVETAGVYADGVNKIRVFIPGTDCLYYLNVGRLKYVLSRYVVDDYLESEDGWDVLYVWLAMDKDTLLKYCDTN